MLAYKVLCGTEACNGGRFNYKDYLPLPKTGWKKWIKPKWLPVGKYFLTLEPQAQFGNRVFLCEYYDVIQPTTDYTIAVKTFRFLEEISLNNCIDPRIFVKIAPFNINGNRWFNMDFCGVNLSHALLPFTDFAEANLNWANLINSNLFRSDFTKANLYKADLSYSNLSQVDFRYANLMDSTLADSTLVNANLLSTDFTNANLRAANLEAAKGYKAKFVGAYLGSANLRGAEFRSADFSHANLRNANLENACIQDAILVNADLTNAIFKNTVIINADFRNAILTERDMHAFKKAGAIV